MCIRDSSKAEKIDVRIIAATNSNLQEMVRQGSFREDLYYRLNVVNIEMPALRERKDDIPLLVHFFLRKYESELNKKHVFKYSEQSRCFRKELLPLRALFAQE